jgi:hypothetical protein
MGTATITENTGAGLYKIKLTDETSGILAEIARKNAIVTEIDSLIPAATTAYDSAVSDYDTGYAALQSLIAELKVLRTSGSASEITAKMAEIRTKTTEVFGLDRIKNQKHRDLQALNTRKFNAEQDAAKWQAMYDALDDDIRDAWCVDYTDNLEVGATVGLAEINSEPKGTVNIYAGGAETDGISTPAIALDPPHFTTRRHQKPGWQKWQPTYRIGVITELDGDICDVALVPANSTEQGLEYQPGWPGVYLIPGERFQGGRTLKADIRDFALTSNGDSKIANTPALMADLQEVNDFGEREPVPAGY